MNLRKIHETDAEPFLRLLEQIERESPFALLEPNERTTSIREQKEDIQDILARDNQIIFVVEDRDQLVGWLGIYGGGYRRNHHSGLVAVGVLESYHRQGIGKWLFEEGEKWAWKQKFRRLELLVAAENKPGIGLYRKMGYQIEGTKRDSYQIDDRFVDEYLMAKLLIKPEPPEHNPYPKW
ncbi:MAG: GNAT family N-acetyltransferase [Bacteroidota bacterium]